MGKNTWKRKVLLVEGSTDVYAIRWMYTKYKGLKSDVDLPFDVVAADTGSKLQGFIEQYPVEDPDAMKRLHADLNANRPTPPFDIQDIKGDSFEKPIGLRLRTDTVDVLGVIADADDGIDNRWNKLIGYFKNEGYHLERPKEGEGLLVEPKDEEQKKIGIWIMPNNAEKGQLEDLIVDMLPEKSDNELRKRIQKNLNDWEEETPRVTHYLPGDRIKAEFYSWLALQNVPSASLGQAFEFNILTPSGEGCKAFIDWLDTLFQA